MPFVGCWPCGLPSRMQGKPEAVGKGIPEAPPWFGPYSAPEGGPPWSGSYRRGPHSYDGSDVSRSKHNCHGALEPKVGNQEIKFTGEGLTQAELQRWACTGAAEFKLKLGRAEALALVHVSLFLDKDLRLGTERGETVKTCVWEKDKLTGMNSPLSLGSKRRRSFARKRMVR